MELDSRRVCSLPLSVMPWRSARVLSSISHSFLWTTERFSIVWLYHHLFAHSSVEGYLGGFLYGAMMRAARNNRVQVSMQT